MIHLTSDQAQQLEKHAVEKYPGECCGILLGRDVDGIRLVDEVRRATNVEPDRHRDRFTIEPLELMHAERDAAMTSQSVLGFYHSHPDHPALPSEFDRENAWPFYSYLIVSVESGRVAGLTSWVFDEQTDQFSEQQVLVRNA